MEILDKPATKLMRIQTLVLTMLVCSSARARASNRLAVLGSPIGKSMRDPP
jgi:hypothetical protein